MGFMIKHWVVAMAVATLVVVTGCKDDGSFKEHEKTSGEEVEAAEEHGDTAIDVADEADEWDTHSGD